MTERLHKYPRTPHLAGSNIQPGDDAPTVPVAALAGRWLVVEEKLDGANAGLSFLPDGELRLQSRGHFLTGGPRERHFALFKTWAATHRAALFAALGSRYVLYGEWLFAKHTLFYDALPHYFLEFDALDTATGEFLSTERRQALLRGLPVVSAPILYAGPAPGWPLTKLIGPSRCRHEGWPETLAAVAAAHGLDPARVRGQTDPTGLMEGLYIKVEADGRVLERSKYVRPGYRQAVAEAGDHWLDRPILPNQLRAGVDLFR